MSKKRRDRRPIVRPNILILEGLWADTGRALRRCGAEVTEVTPWEYDAVEKALLSGTHDAMVLTGGSDIDPAIYGQSLNGAYGIDKLRDAVEMMALWYARRQNLPVLGICRGSQIMNAYMGGTLVQDIGSKHNGGGHFVVAEEGCRTFKRACNSRDLKVVSLHHQCVDEVGPEMRLAARALDGTPEAVESLDGLMLGVQFHPEINATYNPQSHAIFEWLVRQAADRIGGRPPHRPFRVVKDRGYDAWGNDWDDDDDWYHVDHLSDQRALPPAGGTTASKASPSKKHRKAGEAAIPSMRSDAPTLDDIEKIARESMRRHNDDERAREAGLIVPGSIDSTAIECDGSCHYGVCGCEHTSGGLPVCPVCGLLFDVRQDRDDHIVMIHGYGEDSFDCTTALDRYTTNPDAFLERAARRYPELEPPPGHEAWDDPETAADESFESGLRWKSPSADH